MNRSSLVRDLKELGVKQGDLLYLKASMRSIGKVDGGAAALIEAILDVIGEEGTLVVSSFVKVHQLRYLKKHPEIVNDLNTHSYAGAVANEIMKNPKVVFSRHPVQKFAAIGKLANKLMLAHDEHTYAYDPLRVMSEIGGKGLILGKDVIGVGTTHVAVGLLGYRQKRPKVGVRFKNDKGEVKLFKLDWAGLCSKSIFNLLPQYDKVEGAVLSRGKVGNAQSKITDMRSTLEIELDLFKKSKDQFFCGDKNCYHCALTWDFSTDKPLAYFFRNLFSFKFKNVRYFLKHYFRSEKQPPLGYDTPLFLNKRHDVTTKI